MFLKPCIGFKNINISFMYSRRLCSALYISRDNNVVGINSIFKGKHNSMDKINEGNSDSSRRNFSEINSRKTMNPTAGIIIIGDEILKGQTLDTNTNFITKRLFELGIKVKKVSVIPDDLSAISAEVSEFSNKYTFVITTGGIGPTHDDITFEGVAAAFKERLIPNPVIMKLVSDWFKTTDLDSPAMKMAQIPESAILHFGENKELGIKSLYPIITVRNVSVFPGIPHLLRKSFDMLQEKLFHHDGRMFSCSKLFFSCNEVAIASELNQTVKKYPAVTFGSYPELFHSYYQTKVTLESSDEAQVTEAEYYFKSMFPKDIIVNYVGDTISDPWLFFKNLDAEIYAMFEEAIKVIDKCFQKYSPEEVCLCYNGGKDCLVALHMTYAYMVKHHPGKKLQAVYVTEKNGFPQVNEFVNQSVSRYNLNCEIIQGPMKVALFSLQKSHPSVKAMLMGTRRLDPHGDRLDLFSPTDGDWPALMRVNPILDWKYDHVWRFIRQLFLPYCSLYDRGYTSLGSLDNTLPNPALERKDSFGRVIFLPAYLLEDPSLERKGRVF